MIRFFILLCFIYGCTFPTLDQIILRPSIEMENTPADYGFNYEEIILNINSDRQIKVWHVFSEVPKAIVVIFPGSDSNKGRYTEGLSIFIPNGYDVLLMDYEGFGNSVGQPSLTNCVDDCYAVINYVQKLNMPIFIFGVSLGTPLAAKVASDFELKGIIFEGTLNLYKESELWLIQNSVDFPFFWHSANFWMYPQIPEAYDIINYIQKVNEPKLFQHSTEDEITPYDGAVEIYNIAPEPKVFWEMSGKHGQMVRINTELYSRHILDWINSNLH